MPFKINVNYDKYGVKPADAVRFAIRKLNKLLEKDGISRELKRHEYYEKPSQKRRRKILRRKRAAAKLDATKAS